MNADDYIEQLEARIAELEAALEWFAALVHDDGVEAPYPEELWAPILTEAKRVLDKRPKP